MQNLKMFLEYRTVNEVVIKCSETGKEINPEYTIYDEESLNDLIKPFNEIEPLKFNLKGLDELESKISKIDSPKLKFEFKGLFNLLSDRNNLVYNNLHERDKIIKDLNSSLK